MMLHEQWKELSLLRPLCREKLHLLRRLTPRAQRPAVRYLGTKATADQPSRRLRHGVARLPVAPIE
eukprot:8966157-Alexandrium_andersonii.AAC.1